MAEACLPAPLLLAEGYWPPAGADLQALAAAGTAALYRSVDGQSLRLHAAADADGEALARLLPQAALCRLQPLWRMDGAAAGEPAPWLYVVATDVLPEHEADFHAWYETEHAPGLAAVPGTVRASRWLAPGGSPRYHACYELAREEAFGSPPWLAVRATDWSSRVRPHFRNTRRTMYRQVLLPAA